MELVAVKMTDSDFSELALGDPVAATSIKLTPEGPGTFMLEIQRARLNTNAAQIQMRTKTLTAADLFPVIQWLKYPNRCFECGTRIERGAKVRWNPDTKPKQIFCNGCIPV